MDSNYLTHTYFSDDGILSHVIPKFESRLSQQEMAEIIEKTFQQQSSVVIEAGTGIGKTFAYLVPALLSNHKVLISTGTKNLQDQLFFKDLPIILKALKSKKKVALLKGRSNYLCLYRLFLHLNEGRFVSRQTIRELQVVRRWSVSTQDGDIADIHELEDDSSVWPYITSHCDNCLGQVCPYHAKCYLVKARQKALKADIVVVNHALFMSDLILKEEGVGELLPDAGAIIIDEAHQLPQVATQYFGDTLSSRQFAELSHDIKQEYVQFASDDKQLKNLADRLDNLIKKCRLAFGAEKNRGQWQVVKNKPDIINAFDELFDLLSILSEVLEQASGRSKGLYACWKRTTELKTKLQQWFNEKQTGYIDWFETFARSFNLHLSPMNIAESFNTAMTAYDCSWIFTSATLTVKNSFRYFIDSLGLDDVKTSQLSSPFDFEKQALLYLPMHLPQPSSFNYTEKTVEAALPVLRANQGRAFFLFTSFQALYKAEKLLSDLLEYPLFVQGRKPKSVLLKEFVATEHAILLGTNSFWEGVDVRGEQLSCVIIEKLPFESPGEPVLKARMDKMREQGQDPFNEYQLPRAVISLKQGIGRLIRDQNDRGILMVCDPRLLSRSYGQFFLNSLPKMRNTRDLNKVKKFIEDGEVTS